MEQPDLLTQFEYLEQTLLKAQSLIAKLQQRIEAQAYELQEQTRRIQTLEEQLAQNTQAMRVPPINDQLEYFKQEILEIIEKRLNRYQERSPEFSDNHLFKQQLNNQAKALNELQREVDKTYRYEEQISLARAEAGRLNQNISRFQTGLEELSRRIDEQIKPVAYLEERQNMEARLLAEIQAELPDLHKKIESNLTKIQIVEQKIPQFAKYEVALESLREDIRRYREHIDYQVAQRERQIKDWTELAQGAERRIKENEQAMEKYTEHYQLNKRALASLQDFQERLQNDQHRIRELQRVAEERQRAEWEKFQNDFEQRWQKRSMEIQPQFSDLQRNIEAFHKRFEDITKMQRSIEEQMNIVLQIIEEDVQHRASAISNWQNRFEEIASEQG
jgi:chromosome segregation ATPase